MQKPKVAVIVLNYNGRACLLPCLRSLSGLSYEPKEILVIDNASEDGSFEEAQAAFPAFFYLRNPENKGFSAGMNVGIREALARGADFVWLFNPDAHAESGALTALLRAASEHPSAKLFSPRIFDEAGQVWFSGGKINPFRMRAEHISGKQAGAVPYQSDFLTGCALLVHKEAFEKIGYLDERFFLYYEDADFSLRARKAGFQCLVVPDARVVHSERSRYNPEKTYHLVLSGLLFFRKHASWLSRPYFFLHVTIRKAKNRIDIWLRREAAPMVHKAYADYERLSRANVFPRIH